MRASSPRFERPNSNRVAASRSERDKDMAMEEDVEVFDSTLALAAVGGA